MKQAIELQLVPVWNQSVGTTNKNDLEILELGT